MAGFISTEQRSNRLFESQQYICQVKLYVLSKVNFGIDKRKHFRMKMKLMAPNTFGKYFYSRLNASLTQVKAIKSINPSSAFFRQNLECFFITLIMHKGVDRLEFIGTVTLVRINAHQLLNLFFYILRCVELPQYSDHIIYYKNLPLIYVEVQNKPITVGIIRKLIGVNKTNFLPSIWHRICCLPKCLSRLQVPNMCSGDLCSSLQNLQIGLAPLKELMEV